MYEEEFMGMTEPGDIPISGLTYMMFMQNGQPGYYMLYNNLISPNIDLIDGSVQKSDRTLE